MGPSKLQPCLRDLMLLVEGILSISHLSYRAYTQGGSWRKFPRTTQSAMPTLHARSMRCLPHGGKSVQHSISAQNKSIETIQSPIYHALLMMRSSVKQSQVNSIQINPASYSLLENAARCNICRGNIIEWTNVCWLFCHQPSLLSNTTYRPHIQHRERLIINWCHCPWRVTEVSQFLLFWVLLPPVSLQEVSNRHKCISHASHTSHLWEMLRASKPDALY